MTDEPGVALVCFGADCTTLLLFDPVRQAIAAVHAGWRGTAQGIAYKAVLRMQAEFGIDSLYARLFQPDAVQKLQIDVRFFPARLDGGFGVRGAGGRTEIREARNS